MIQYPPLLQKELVAQAIGSTNFKQKVYNTNLKEKSIESMSKAAKSILEKVDGAPLISKRTEFAEKTVVSLLTDTGERDLSLWQFE